MCGIAGMLSAPGSSTELEQLAMRMADALAHRGPDGSGAWADGSAGVALGHRRLAVVDLSATGNQPMQSHDGRWVVVFNGEIYDHREIRRLLEAEGSRFRGHSDTEVLVEAIARWGLVRALRTANGMFALGAWDRHERRLFLARDRMGEKPLYYARDGRSFLFASELKAIRAHPDFRPEVDRDTLAAYLRTGFVPGGRCIYRGVSTLPPGTVLRVGTGATARVEEPAPFWSLSEMVAGAVRDRFAGDAVEAEAALDALLRDSVRLRLEADVPLGAFLSGGIDSSLVVALAQAEARRPVRTFTVAFSDASVDESADARRVAAHLGTDHTEVAVGAQDALALVPGLPNTWDEPFADPSQLPTQLVCAMARRHVTVALSGDGGDEVFGGYNRYVLGRSALRWGRRMPSPARRAVARAILGVAPARWDALVGAASRVAPTRARVRNPGDKLHKLAAVLRAAGADGAYTALASVWPDAGSVVLGAGTATDGGDVPLGDPLPLADPVERMMLMDALTTLPDDMLVKVDRASMSVGLEVRVPYLDHRVVEHAWRLPLDLKIQDGRGKWILRRLLHRYVPEHLVDRPKMGFDPPIAAWLRGPLRDWAETLLAEPRLRQEGYLRPEPVRRRWDEHLSGKRNHDYALWAVLMFQAWLEPNASA